MSVIYDSSAVFEYYTHLKAKGGIKIPFKQAIEVFGIKKAVESLDAKFKTEIIYVVPSLSGNKGPLEINGKKFYEY
ncbi:MAG: hypothetical protein GOU98_00640 [Candidatus Altiarchaeota archaeon]|nr:hypothetical protein [Candidatus Altiarchaeota archaeon]